MFDLFTNFQQSLRDLKNNHDIDITHPNGAIIYGKPYPAVSKTVWLDSQPSTGPNKHNVYYRFSIPLENGLRVSVSKRTENNVPLIVSKMEVPHKFIFGQRDGTDITSYAYRYAHKGATSESDSQDHLKESMAGVSPSYKHNDNPDDMFHDYMKSVFRLPRFGSTERHFTHSRPVLSGRPVLTYQRLMTDDELNDFYQQTQTLTSPTDKHTLYPNISHEITEEKYPHNIHLYFDGDERRIRQYDYDIKTEKLTTDETWDE